MQTSAEMRGKLFEHGQARSELIFFDEFIGHMRLADRAWAADDARNAGVLIDAGFRAERDDISGSGAGEFG